MPARAIASGTISFGLVTIPIKLYTATSSKTVRFSMLHASDKGRLRQSYACRVCDEPVGRNDTVRGYEHARDQYVVVTDEDLETIEKRGDRALEIEEFVPISQVDPVYFDHANLLGPDKGGLKAYALLRDAMLDSGKVAVGRYRTRGREQLVLIRPTREGLMLHSLFYADEVRSFEDLEIGAAVESKEQERLLANQLIEQLSRKTFEPERYEDTYRRELLEAIDRKVAGEEIVVMPATEPREKIIDLVAALKQSLADRGEADGADRKRPLSKGRKKASRRKSGTAP